MAFANCTDTILWWIHLPFMHHIHEAVDTLDLSSCVPASLNETASIRRISNHCCLVRSDLRD